MSPFARIAAAVVLLWLCSASAFAQTAPGWTFDVVHEFTAAEGTPAGPLTEGVDGCLYGVTSNGGPDDKGTIYSLCEQGGTWVYSQVYAFTGPEGASPIEQVVQNTDGLLYGTTSLGGAHNLGTVYRVAKTGAHTILHSFGGTRGMTLFVGSCVTTIQASRPVHPRALKKLRHSPGLLAGVTIGTRQHTPCTGEFMVPTGHSTFYVGTDGTVNLNERGISDWVFDDLFEGVDGILFGRSSTTTVRFSDGRTITDIGASTEGRDRVFYGTAAHWMSPGFAAAYPPDYSTLVFAAYSAGSAAPPLVHASDGYLYTTLGSTAGGWRLVRVFPFTAGGTDPIQTVHEFGSAAGDPAEPRGSLLETGGGNEFWGATAKGGAQERGVVYRIIRDITGTRLAVTSATAAYRQTATVVGRLTTFDGTPVPGQSVDLLIWNSVGPRSVLAPAVTDADGRVTWTFSTDEEFERFSVPLPGVTPQHKLQLRHGGNATYAASVATAPLIVSPVPLTVAWLGDSAVWEGTSISEVCRYRAEPSDVETTATCSGLPADPLPAGTYTVAMTVRPLSHPGYTATTISRTLVVVPEQRPEGYGFRTEDLYLYFENTGEQASALSGPLSGVFRTGGRAGYGGEIPGFRPYVVELNGDGHPDLFLYNETTGVWMRRVNFAERPGGWIVWAQGAWAPGWKLTPLHVNEDMLTDFFLYNPTSGQWFVAVTIPNGAGFAYYGGAWAKNWQVHRANWNGDGLDDLFLYNADTGQWFRVTTLAPGSFDYATGHWAKHWELYPSDFTGDGLTDVFLYSRASGKTFVAYTLGNSFGYFEGPNWAKDWQITVMRLNEDARSDLFLYNPATGAWAAGLMWPHGQFVFAPHLSGRWAPGWTLQPLDTAKDGRDELVLYNATTGQWFQVTFAMRDDGFPFVWRYTSGMWDPGATLIRIR